jgi:hypothetical protein
MDIVKVKLLNYTFRFRKLHWREEFGLAFDEKSDRLRTILSRALVEVSGLPVKSGAEAMKILEAVPSAIVRRVFIVYKGSLPASRVFHTVGLYKAPEPNRLIKKMQEAEEGRDQVMDRVEREMESRFGRKELEEQRELERQMFRNSKGRGVVPATADDTVPEPQPRPDKGLGTRPPNKLATQVPLAPNGPSEKKYV